MQDTQHIQRSSQGLVAQVLTTGVLALLILIFGTLFFSAVFGWTPTEGKLSILLLWIFIVGGWSIAALKLWFSWRAQFYEIGTESLIVHVKAGMWGTAQTIYRYESFISIRMVQGYWGKRFGFGDVYITIPKMENDVVLRDVVDPAGQLSGIQARMAERASASSSLIN
jgi:hypothetical protein